MDDDWDDSEQNEERQYIFDRECNYYELEDLEHVSVREKNEYRVMHLNIQSLPSKFDNLKIMLYRMQDIGKRLDFILLCETFLTMTNAHMFNIDGYNFVCYNRKNSSRGGVAIYLRNDIDYIERPDLGVCVDGEFESIMIEVKSMEKKIIIGEIYRVPGTNEKNIHRSI
jgi:exonuclease III